MSTAKKVASMSTVGRRYNNEVEISLLSLYSDDSPVSLQEKVCVFAAFHFFVFHFRKTKTIPSCSACLPRHAHMVCFQNLWWGFF